MANEEQNLTSRQRTLGRAREYFPDRNFADIGAQPAEGEDVADLDDAIEEMIEGYASRQAEYDENNGRLKDLLMGDDPDAPEFMDLWLKYKSPEVAYQIMHGGEGLEGEAMEAFNERKRLRDENAEIQSKADAGYDESLERLHNWGQSRGLTLEQERDIMVKLINIAVSGFCEGKYTEEDFEMVHNAINHDADVESARVEGEVAGRNAKIAAARRERGVSSAMPPSGTRGQAGSVQERRPAPVSQSPWAGIK